MFKTSSSTHAELILLWNDNDIKKSMLYDDFDAVVGGVAPMPQYAKQKKMGAFVQIDDTLTVKGVALFTVNFDRSGYPENGWNVPLSHLVELAGLGPDLGKGPIRLACRSQCPVSWHSTKLWDPVMQGEDSTFAQIQRAIPDACNRLGIRRAKSYTFTETGIPVLTEAALQPSTSTAPLPDLEASALEQKIQDLTLQLNTVLTEKEETINLQSYVHQQQLDILQTQNMKLIDQQKTLKNQYDIQQERLEALNGQIVSLSGIEESLREAGLTMADVRNSPQAQMFYLESGHRHFTWLVGGEVKGNEPINAVMSQVIQRKIIRALDGTGQASGLSPDTVPTAIAVVLFLALIPLGTVLGYVWLLLGYLFFLLLLRTNQLEIREHLDEVEELEVTH